MPAGIMVEILPSELAQVVESVFGTMMGLEAGGSEAPWRPSADRLTAAVHLTGDWSGALLLERDRAQACRLAGRFLSIHAPRAVDDVLRDRLGSRSHIV